MTHWSSAAFKVAAAPVVELVKLTPIAGSATLTTDSSMKARLDARMVAASTIPAFDVAAPLWLVARLVSLAHGIAHAIRR